MTTTTTLDDGSFRLLRALCCRWDAIVPTCRRKTPAAPRPRAGAHRPLVGGVERLDPGAGRADRPRRAPRGAGARLQVVRGAGLDGRRAAVLRRPQQRRLALAARATGAREFLRPSGYTGTVPRGGEPGSNGLAVDAAGRLYLCQHGDRRIARLAPDGKTFETVADSFDGKRFNSPNDLVVRPNGDVYFTDPIYGLDGHEKDPDARDPVERRLPRARRRRRRRARQDADVPERPGVLARRQDAVRLGVRSGARDLDGLRRRRERRRRATGACSSTRRRS